MLAALGFTPLFTRVERLSAGLALTGGASAAGMGAAGTGPTGIGTALGFTPLFSRVERLSTGLTLTGRASAAGMGAAAMREEAWVRQEASQQSQADPARTHPDQGTVG